MSCFRAKTEPEPGFTVLEQRKRTSTVVLSTEEISCFSREHENNDDDFFFHSVFLWLVLSDNKHTAP